MYIYVRHRYENVVCQLNVSLWQRQKSQFRLFGQKSGLTTVRGWYRCAFVGRACYSHGTLGYNDWPIILFFFSILLVDGVPLRYTTPTTGVDY